MARLQRLSEKSVVVLGLIAEGRGYSHIVEGNDEISYIDIFNAAREALLLNESLPDYGERMDKIKHQHPRAYERWTDEEDARLSAMHARGRTVAEMAQQLGRQPSAIRSRLTKLAPIPTDSEQGGR